MTPESKYNQLVMSFKEAMDSQMFGKRCAKIFGKPFISFHNDEVAFRIGREVIDQYLEEFEGSKLFDPSGKNRPFKDWIQLSSNHYQEWEKMGQLAKKYTLDHL